MRLRRGVQGPACRRISLARLLAWLLAWLLVWLLVWLRGDAWSQALPRMAGPR